MTKPDASDDVETAQVDDLKTVQRRASDLARETEAATQIYDRTAWIIYAAMFVAIPFVVLLFRLHMQSWHYYAAGALIVACALAIPALEFAALVKRDKAIKAVRRAQEANEAMRMPQ